MLSFFYGLARLVAWCHAYSEALSGNPRPLLRRVRNKYLIYKPLNRITRR